MADVVLSDNDPEPPRRPVLDYLEIPLRYPKHFIVPFVAVVMVAVLGLVLMPRKFRSATLILVERDQLPDNVVAPVTTEGVGQRLETIRQVVLSRTRLEKVIEELDPYPDSAGQPSHVIVAAMRGSISINVTGRDSFSISYVNEDPQKAMLVTNMLANQFIEDSARIRDHLTQRAADFMDRSLAEARRELEERETALRLHKQKFRGSLPEELDTNLRVLQQLQLEQQTLSANMSTLEQRRAALERSLLESRRLAGSRAEGGPVGELAKLKQSLAELRLRYTDEHPDVRSLLTRIERLESQLENADGANRTASASAATNPELASISLSLEAVENDIEELAQRRTVLDGKVAEYKYRIERTPQAEEELLDLTRDYEQLRQNYNQLLRKDLDAEMARRLEQYWRAEYFRILDPAHLPQRPIRPYAFLLLVGGLAAGVLAGLIAALIADFLDDSPKSEGDLEAAFPYPVLATIPHVARRRWGMLRRAG